MSLTEPIVEGAWYLLEDNFIAGQAIPRTEYFSYGTRQSFTICGFGYFPDGRPCLGSPRKIRQVHLIPTDPAEVVAELRGLHKTAKHMSTSLFEGITAQREHTGAAIAFDNAADLVAKKLGVTK